MRIFSQSSNYAKTQAPPDPVTQLSSCHWASGFAPVLSFSSTQPKPFAMQITPTAINGVLILEPKVFGDTRGFFMESFNQKTFNQAAGYDVVFVQDNHSRSSKGVLRGLHFQRPPHAQGKLVRVTQGSVYDVAVDVRRSSPTFGKVVGVELTGENHRQLWIPPGMAHGFLVTSESADFLYKTTDYYAPQAEGCVLWSDPALAIAWPDVGAPPQLAAKDAAAPLLADAQIF
jgi:dTDP-4-dehydrorhamnose 3,5-epimerase